MTSMYGLPGHEQFYFDPASCYECEIDPNYTDQEEWVIEEWSIAPHINRIVDTLSIIDNVVEWADDLDEIGSEDLRKAADSEVIEAFEKARQLWASKIHYDYADQLIARHTLIISEAGPLFDGKPLYKTRWIESNII